MNAEMRTHTTAIGHHIKAEMIAIRIGTKINGKPSRTIRQTNIVQKVGHPTKKRPDTTRSRARGGSYEEVLVTNWMGPGVTVSAPGSDQMDDPSEHAD